MRGVVRGRVPRVVPLIGLAMSRTPRPSPSFAPVLVILLGLAAAHFAWNTTRQAERHERQLQDQQRGDAYARRLADFLGGQAGIVRFLRGWHHADSHLPDSVLHDVLNDLLADDDRSGALRYLAWVEHVPPGGLPAWEAARGLTVRGVDGQPVPHDVDHYVIAQVLPQTPGQELVGKDLGTDPARLEAIRRAAQRNGPAMSAPVTMDEPPGDRTPAVLVAMPVHAEGPSASAADRSGAASGAVVAVFALDELLHDAFRPLLHEAGLPPVCIVVLENGQTVGSSGQPIVAGERLSSTEIDVCGRRWTVQTFPAAIEPLTVDQLLARPSLLLPIAVFIVTVLCAWIVWTLNQRNLVIQQQVAQQTADMRQKNLVLEGKERELHDANRRLLEMSNTDPLTGLLNRRAFEVQLDLERERARRTGQSWGLLILDVDRFKDFNDRHGHVAGDEALRRVAAIIQNEARRIDTVARYGGEEFVVLAGGADMAGLLALGERIRSRIQEAAIAHEGLPSGVLTVSVGGSLSSPTNAHDSRPVFELADRCLYQAKSTGRNRVVMLA